MNENEMFEDVRRICYAVGISVDKVAKKYGQDQNNVLELFMETMKKIQDGMKEKANKER